MKKRILILIAIVMVIALVLGAGFYFGYFGSRFPKLAPDGVASITVWSHDGLRQLDAGEVVTVISAYNTAVYDGRATGEGGTPDFGAEILLTNGKTIWINRFSGSVSEVFTDGLFKRAFYLESASLMSAIEQMAKNSRHL